MTLIHIVVILIAIGVLLWAVNSVIPLDPRIRQIISAVVIVAVVLWLLAIFIPGLGFSTIRVR